MEDIKKKAEIKFLKMKFILSEMKNRFMGNNGKSDITEEKFSGHKDNHTVRYYSITK